MTGWDAVGVLLVIVVTIPLLLRLHRRWKGSMDRHFAAAQAIANGGPCLCAHPERPGWLHSPVRCVPPTPPCDCGGSLRDASGVMHGPTVCAPLREALFPKRGAA